MGRKKGKGQQEGAAGGSGQEQQQQPQKQQQQPQSQQQQQPQRQQQSSVGQQGEEKQGRAQRSSQQQAGGDQRSQQQQGRGQGGPQPKGGDQQRKQQGKGEKGDHQHRQPQQAWVKEAPQPQKSAWGQSAPEPQQQTGGDQRSQQQQGIGQGGSQPKGGAQQRQPQQQGGQRGFHQQAGGDQRSQQQQQQQSRGQGGPQSKGGDQQRQQQGRRERVDHQHRQPQAWGKEAPQPQKSAWGQSAPEPQQQTGGDQRSQQQQQQDWKQRGPQQEAGAGDQRQPQPYDPQKGARKKEPRQQKQPQPTEVKSPTPSISQSPSVQSIASSISEISVSVSPSHVCLDRGTKGRKIIIETNYLQLVIDKIISCAYQYDIKFDPDTPKKLLRLAFNEFCSRHLPRTFLAFDGRAIFYSPVELPEKIIAQSFEVTVTNDGRDRTFKITVTKTQNPKIDLNVLKNYQGLRIFDKPMRAIQCLDVVLRSPCYSKSVQAGRSFYNKPKEFLDLRDGYEMWYGLFQAAVLGETPLLNIDICHKAFPSDKNVIDIIRTNRYADVNRELDFRNYNDLKQFLRGLDIIYRSPDGTSKTYKFNDLKDTAEKQEFVPGDGNRTTILNYFRSKNVNLRYPKMPCLHVGSRVRTIYLPAELCEIAPGQASMKKTNTNQVREIIRFAAVDTITRKTKILDSFRPFNHNIDPIIRAFGISIDNNFLNVAARIIDTPQLQYGGDRKIQPINGSWKADNVEYIKPSKATKWAILMTNQRQNEFEVQKFGKMILSYSKSLNMQICDGYDVLKQFDNRRLDDEFKRIKSQGYDLCFVVISQPQSYAEVKQGAEIKSGVLTQCVKFETLQKRLNPSTVQNILLKVNAKLNGINHKISEKDKTNIMKNDVMFLGADVTHPSPEQRSIPSVVGVAASHDENGFQYNMRWRLQDPKKEIIQDMENILKDQLEFYKAKRNKYPSKIMYYRDGVSEGQFEHVRATELLAMDRACKNIKPKPQITCIVVQKRHHTRFFPKDSRDAVGRYKNVPPGTIVDTKITHPNESQFFLVSHESIQGTAKPTKYCIIRDDSKFNIDDLQAITYNLCHLFSRCNRTVSYPAPAYNAHLAAYRGRVYIEQRNPINMNNLEREYNNRKVKEEVYLNSPMYFV